MWWVVFLWRVVFAWVAGHIEQLKCMNGAFDEFGSFTYCEFAGDLVGKQFGHDEMTFTMDEIDFYFVDVKVGGHSFLHPFAAQ